MNTYNNNNIQLFCDKLDELKLVFNQFKYQVNESRNLCILDSSYNYQEIKQKCTCKTGLSMTESYADQRYIKCRRHLCRKYINYGCEKCKYTDCSLFNCKN